MLLNRERFLVLIPSVNIRRQSLQSVRFPWESLWDWADTSDSGEGPTKPVGYCLQLDGRDHIRTRESALWEST